MLGVREPLKWTCDAAKGLVINIPEELQEAGRRPCEFAWAVRIPTTARAIATELDEYVLRPRACKRQSLTATSVRAII